MTGKLFVALAGIMLLAGFMPTAHADNSAEIILLPHAEQLKPSRVLESLSSCVLKKDNDTVAGYSSGYLTGDRTVTLFDPSGCGAPSYPFQIQSLSFALIGLTGYHWPLTVDVVVFSAVADGTGCSRPGSELYRFRTDCDSTSFTAPNIGTVMFPDPWCVAKPFFIGIEYSDKDAGSYPSVVFDNNPAPVRCDNWQYSSGQWQEWYAYWTTVPGYPVFWVNGTTDAQLVCPDVDSDQVFDLADNCPCTYNPDQADTDQDGVGNVCEGCCTGTTGNVDSDPESRINLTDVAALVDFIYIHRKPICCQTAANTSGDTLGEINLTDVIKLINFIYIQSTSLAPCL